MFEWYESALSLVKFDVAEIRKNCVCPVHRKKVSIELDYLSDGTYAHISKYCCAEHAQRVAEMLAKLQLLDHIRVEH